MQQFKTVHPNIHLFKVNNRNTRKRCEICSMLTITRNATRFNNRDDLLHVSFTLKISIFSEAYKETSRTSMMELLL